MDNHLIYRSSKGAELVRERYLRFLQHWPVANSRLRIPTSQGETFTVASGPPDAPPLLLLHGGGGNAAMWLGDIRSFAEHFRVYAVDMIGEPGLSAPSRPALSSDAYALWLDEVLSALEIDSVRLVGISLGGWLALDYAIRRSRRVKALAVLCPGGIGRQKIGFVFQALTLRMLGDWGKRKLVERVFGRRPANPHPAAKAFTDFVELIHKHFRQRRVMLPIFPDDALRRLDVPILAIVGARDVLINSADTKRRLERLAPKSEVAYLPDEGHVLVNQSQRILEFLSHAEINA